MFFDFYREVADELIATLSTTPPNDEQCRYLTSQMLMNINSALSTLDNGQLLLLFTPNYSSLSQELHYVSDNLSVN